MLEEEGGNDRKRWGTWEELILGGAVLRHGSHNWAAVASELQTRTLYPYLFTPQECKAKYEDLQERYSGCSWFEELRKKRVEELRRALEKSEDSIGSLESKLESLKSEKGVCDNANYSSTRAQSPVLFAKSESSEKEAHKYGLSAGSSTQETKTNWSPPPCQVAKETSKPVIWEGGCRAEKFPSIDELVENGVSIRRRRGKRRRKDLSNKEVKELSVGENNLLGSPDFVSTSLGKDQNPCTSNQEFDDFTNILDSIMDNQYASLFQRRLDSQKRRRYKKLVRQHVDLDTIRTRVANRSITSLVELLRDLLLLANNVLVFYSKTTREYKCGLVLRDLVTKRLNQFRKSSMANNNTTTMTKKPPAKPRSARPFNRKIGNKRPPNNVDSPSSVESSALAKRSFPGRRGKIGRVRRGHGDGGIQAETPMKVRKRVRVK